MGGGGPNQFCVWLQKKATLFVACFAQEMSGLKSENLVELGEEGKIYFGYCLQKISVPLIWSINWPKVPVSAPNNGQAQIFLNWRKEKGMREEEAAKGHPKGHPSFGTPSMGPYIIIPRLEKMPKKEVGESNRRVASIKSHLGGLNLCRFFHSKKFHGLISKSLQI